MKIVILSGGLGYRLKEETEFKPKPMVNIGGKPILWHIMKIYSYYGFNDFIIALGYKGEYIKQYFLNEQLYANDFSIETKNGEKKIYKNDLKLDDFKITFVDTGLETQPGERILRIKDYIPDEDDTFMVTYGDGLSDININDLLKFHKKQKTIGTITSVHPRSKYGLLSVKNHKAVGFVEKPILKDWVNGGFMVFDKKIFSYIKKGEIEHEAFKRLIKKSELSVYIHEGFWHSMDTYPDVDALNKMWLENPKWKIW